MSVDTLFECIQCTIDSTPISYEFLPYQCRLSTNPRVSTAIKSHQDEHLRVHFRAAQPAGKSGP